MERLERAMDGGREWGETSGQVVQAVFKNNDISINIVSVLKIRIYRVRIATIQLGEPHLTTSTIIC